MEINLTKPEKALFDTVSQVANEMGIESYLIGGFVRDKILGRETKDADAYNVGVFGFPA